MEVDNDPDFLRQFMLYRIRKTKIHCTRLVFEPRTMVVANLARYWLSGVFDRQVVHEVD